MVDLKSLLPEELEEYLKSLGQPKFRAKQLFSWFSKGACSFEEMSNIPKALGEKLSSDAYINSLKLLKKQVSAIKLVKRLSSSLVIRLTLLRLHSLLYYFMTS